MKRSAPPKSSARKCFAEGLQKMLFKVSAIALVGFLIAGCTAQTATIKSHQTISETTPSTTVYYYPLSGQTPTQQDRDHYECYLWAVNQSGFDPSQSQLAPHQRVEIIPSSPPGSGVAVGAAGGAALGAIITGPHSNGKGLVFGVITGIILGAASELAKQKQAAQLQQQLDEQENQQYCQLEKQADSYRRAISACLEGKGYQVQ